MEHVGTQDSFGIRENLAIIFRNQKKILTVLFSTVFITLLGSYLVSKVYEADARVLIQHYRETSIISTTSVPSNSYTARAPQEQLLSEIEIFKSNAVLKKAVELLGTEKVLEKMSWRWDWLFAAPGKISAGIKNGLWSFTPTKLLFEWVGLSKSPQKDKTILAVRKIKKQLWIEPVKGTNVFSIVFKSPDPEFSALMVNSMIDAYQDYHVYLRQGIRGSQLFLEEVDRLKNELRTAKGKLLKLKHNYGIVSVEPQIQLMLEKLSKTRTTMQRIQLESIEAELRIEEIQRQMETQPKVISLENSWTRNPTLTALTSQLAKLEIEKNRYVLGSASVARLDEEIATVKYRIANEKKSVRGMGRSGVNPVYQGLQKDLSIEQKKYQGLTQSHSNLEKQKQQEEKQLRQFDEEKVSIHEMKLDIEVKEHALKLYSKKQQELRISAMLNDKKVSDVAPIEMAIVPHKASSPIIIKNLIVAIIAGLSGGLLVAYASEYFRRTITTKEEVEDTLGYPCLAAFRLVNDENKDEADAQNSFEVRHFNEAVRQLNRQKGIQSLFIASTVPDEGKSQIAEALAYSLTEKNTRVLLVENLFADQIEESSSDSEMSFQFEVLVAPDNPNLFHVKKVLSKFSATSTTGSKKSSQRDLEQFKRDLEQFVDLSISTSGNKKPSRHDFTRSIEKSLSTTGTKKPMRRDLTQFIKEVKNEYGIVIVDGPALSNVPESIELASQMDGVIFVVEADRSSSISISKALNSLKNAGAAVYGVVLNKRSFPIPDWAYNWLLLSVK